MIDLMTASLFLDLLDSELPRQAIFLQSAESAVSVQYAVANYFASRFGPRTINLPALSSKLQLGKEFL